MVVEKECNIVLVMFDNGFGGFGVDLSSRPINLLRSELWHNRPQHQLMEDCLISRRDLIRR